MAAFQTVWSIDVGKSSLKAVQMHRERHSLEILAVDKVDYPIDGNGIDALQGPKAALHTFASRNVINDPVIVSHPGHAAFSRFIQLPPVDAKKLGEMIGYEAQQQIPFPIDEVIWDYHICEDEGQGLEREVGIFAVRKEVISDFIMDYESEGIRPDHVSVGYVGLLDYVQFDLRPKGPSVIVDIGSDHTDLLIVDGKRFWIRNLGIAGNDITQTIADRFKLAFDEAERIKREVAQNKDQLGKVFTVVQPILKDLVNEIHRSVGFYKSQAGDVKFEDVYLFGNAAKLVGIQRFLAEHLRFKVHVEKGFHRIRVNREANVALLQKDFPAFASVVGNGALALGEGMCDVNLLPRERQEELSFQSKQRMVLIAALCLFIAPILLLLIFNKKIERVETAKQESETVKPYISNRKALRTLEGTTRQELEERSSRLVGHGSDRLQPLIACQAIGLTFASFHSDDPPRATAQVAAGRDREAALAVPKSALESEVGESNLRKAWIVNFDSQSVALDARARKLEGRQLDDVPHVPGYEMIVDGMIVDQGNAEENTKFVRERVRDPLQVKLRELTGQDVTVTIEPVPGAAPNELYSKNDRIKESGVRRGGQDRDQGADFFEFKLRWAQHSRPLPAASEEGAN